MSKYSHSIYSFFFLSFPFPLPIPLPIHLPIPHALAPAFASLVRLVFFFGHRIFIGGGRRFWFFWYLVFGIRILVGLVFGVQFGLFVFGAWFGLIFFGFLVFDF